VEAIRLVPLHDADRRERVDRGPMHGVLEVAEPILLGPHQPEPPTYHGGGLVAADGLLRSERVVRIPLQEPRLGERDDRCLVG
jgi:hypothetical protein